MELADGLSHRPPGSREQGPQPKAGYKTGEGMMAQIPGPKVKQSPMFSQPSKSFPFLTLCWLKTFSTYGFFILSFVNTFKTFHVQIIMWRKPLDVFVEELKITFKIFLSDMENFNSFFKFLS